jgi:hypothetical protein
LEFLFITFETILKLPKDIKLCSENSFTYLSCDRIGTDSCSSKLIALCVILVACRFGEICFGENRFGEKPIRRKPFWRKTLSFYFI